MIIGFLGKGGSGKSTLATQTALFLQKQHKNVLAIDADYNMDLSHNLQAPADMQFLGETARVDMKNFLNVPMSMSYRDIVLQVGDNTRFTVDPVDSFTAAYSTQTPQGIRVMSVGPHTLNVLTDTVCSHALGGSLKVYLPLLQLGNTDAVVVDEKAGVDSVGTGIPTGFTMPVIVVEPTVYGIKAAKQIAEALHHYHMPYVFVLNKVKSDTDILSIEKELGGLVVSCIPFSEEISDVYIEPIVKYVEGYIQSHGDTRFKQSVAKFTFNKEYNG